jgi:hypothetical protein
MKAKILHIFLFMLVAGYANAQFAHFPFDSNVLDQKEEIQSQASPSGLTFVNDPARGQVVQFDGTSGFISLGTGAYNFPQAVSINIWFNWTTEVANQWWTRLFDFGSHVDNNPPDERNVLFVALYAFNDKMQLNFHPKTWAPGTDSTLTSINQIQRNRWYMFTFVHSPNSIKLYLDGVLQDEATLPNITPASMSDFQNLWLGKANWPDPLFKGMMDELTFWDKALTQEEITALYGTFGTNVEALKENAGIYSYGNIIRIDIPEASNATVEVFNLLGARVYNKANLYSTSEIKDLPSGVYVVRVANNNRITTRKVFVQER